MAELGVYGSDAGMGLAGFQEAYMGDQGFNNPPVEDPTTKAINDLRATYQRQIDNATGQSKRIYQIRKDRWESQVAQDSPSPNKRGTWGTGTGFTSNGAPGSASGTMMAPVQPGAAASQPGASTGAVPDNAEGSPFQSPGLPPRADNLQGQQSPKQSGQGNEMTSSGIAKSFLADMATNGISNLQRRNLQQNIRTAQAQRGLEYGGAAVKQEANIVGQFVQKNRLQASTQLSQLTQSEAMVQPQIEAYMANTGAALRSSVNPQLSTPVQSLSALYGGASTGLNSIFGLSQLF